MLDEASFGTRVASCLPVLRAIAVREVGAAEADDVVQEALLRAWRRRSTFDSERGSLRVWLIAILLDRARRRRTRNTPELVRPQASEVSTGPVDNDRLDVECAVRKLPRRQRQVVTLFYLADLSIDEVARVLDLRPGSVKAHLSRARTSLRVFLEVP